jgi:acetylxylan esterase
MNRYCAFTLASLFVALTSAAPAMAGTYSKVDQATWQQGVTGLPTYVNMYIFVPATLATKPPMVVYTHHCGGDAASSHQSQSGLEKLADTNGFIMLYPEATGENCWDAGSVRSMKNGGGGDTGAVVQMVKYVISKYSADPNRVYAAGDSSGGIMTEALLGVYPDIFMGGVSIMGVPCGCWAQGYNDVTGKPSNGTGQWSGDCAGGKVSKTAQAWGDLVRSYFPTYKGHRPRLQHWHGDSDTTLNFKNVAEDIKEWTNLLGLSETPTGTEANTPKSGTTHQFWKNSCFTVYETFVLAGVGHMVSGDANSMAKYFGLDKKDGEDPETAACGPGAVPGGGGSGTGGTGGSTGTGGNTGTGGGAGGGTSGHGGTTDTKTTSNGGAQGGSTIATSGMAGQGGSTKATTSAGGKGGSNGGTISPSSSSSSAGSDGGASSSSSSSAGSNGGSSSSSASSNGNAGSSSSSSSASAQAGSSSSAGTTSSGSSGGCAIGGQGHGSAFALLALALLGLVLRRQRRR